jgi:ubiquitin C-terminal hydrolase
MLEQLASQKNENPDCLVDQIGIDGGMHKYRVEREERLFVRAPASLWLQIKRMKVVAPSSRGCLQTLFSCLFPSSTSPTQKLHNPIKAQERISIETVEEENPTTYQLDSFIVHQGSSMDSGHYVAYRLVEVEPGKKVWFEMDDGTVSSLTDEQALNVRKQGYAYHYSKV